MAPKKKKGTKGKKGKKGKKGAKKGAGGPDMYEVPIMDDPKLAIQKAHLIISLASPTKFLGFEIDVPINYTVDYIRRKIIEHHDGSIADVMICMSHSHFCLEESLNPNKTLEEAGINTAGKYNLVYDFAPKENKSKTLSMVDTTIEFKVKTINNEFHLFSLNSETRVSELKCKISERLGIGVTNQRLLFKGRLLKDNFPISQYLSGTTAENSEQIIQLIQIGDSNVGNKEATNTQIPASTSAQPNLNTNPTITNNSTTTNNNNQNRSNQGVRQEIRMDPERLNQAMGNIMRDPRVMEGIQSIVSQVITGNPPVAGNIESRPLSENRIHTPSTIPQAELPLVKQVHLPLDNLSNLHSITSSLLSPPEAFPHIPRLEGAHSSLSIIGSYMYRVQFQLSRLLPNLLLAGELLECERSMNLRERERAEKTINLVGRGLVEAVYGIVPISHILRDIILGDNPSGVIIKNQPDQDMIPLVGGSIGGDGNIMGGGSGGNIMGGGPSGNVVGGEEDIRVMGSLGNMRNILNNALGSMSNIDNERAPDVQQFLQQGVQFLDAILGRNTLHMRISDIITQLEGNGNQESSSDIDYFFTHILGNLTIRQMMDVLGGNLDSLHDILPLIQEKLRVSIGRDTPKNRRRKVKAVVKRVTESMIIPQQLESHLIQGGRYPNPQTACAHLLYPYILQLVHVVMSHEPSVEPDTTIPQINNLLSAMLGESITALQSCFTGGTADVVLFLRTNVNHLLVTMGGSDIGPFIAQFGTNSLMTLVTRAYTFSLNNPPQPVTMEDQSHFQDIISEGEDDNIIMGENINIPLTDTIVMEESKLGSQFESENVDIGIDIPSIAQGLSRVDSFDHLSADEVLDCMNSMIDDDIPAISEAEQGGKLSRAYLFTSSFASSIHLKMDIISRCLSKANPANLLKKRLDHSTRESLPEIKAQVESLEITKELNDGYLHLLTTEFLEHCQNNPDYEPDKHKNLAKLSTYKNSQVDIKLSKFYEINNKQLTHTAFMRILIVDAFSELPESRRAFKEFHKYIKKTFEHHKSGTFVTPEFAVKKMCDLDSYLYQLNTQYTHNDAKKLFDRLDLAFIDGDANLLPWSKQARKLALFFQMCKRTNKCLFACSVGLSMLVYYCATNLEEINVINEGGKGGDFADIYEIPEDVRRSMYPKDVFLDAATGDFFSFRQENEEWVPNGNTGLHHTRIAEKFNSLGKYFKKAATYKTNPLDQDMLYRNKLDEITCSLRKMHLQHWLFKGVKPKFIVENKNAWDPHPINITNILHVEKNYTNLAESERGPQVIEHKNTIAIQFHISHLYPDTIKILHNFVERRLKQIQTDDKLHIDLEAANSREKKVFSKIQLLSGIVFSEHKDKGKASSILEASKELEGEPKRKRNDRKSRPGTSMGDREMLKCSGFSHSGNTVSKRIGVVVVENNCMHTGNIKPLPPNASSGQKQIWLDPTRQPGHTYTLTGGIWTTNGMANSGHANLLSLSPNPRNIKPHGRIPNIIGNRSQSQSNIEVTSVLPPGEFDKSRNVDNKYKSSSMIPNTTRDLEFVSQIVHLDTKTPGRYKSVEDIDTHRGEILAISKIGCRSISPYTEEDIENRTYSLDPENYINLRTNAVTKNFQEKFQQNLIKDLSILGRSSAKSIRKYLHPKLETQYLPEEKKMLFPGMKKVNQFWRERSETRNKIIEKSASVFPFCRYKEFKKMPQTNFDIPSFRVSGPYRTPTELNYEKELVN